MTVNTTNNVAVFTGNDVADEFDFTFKVFEEDHLVVRRLVIATGIIDKTYTTDEYTISGLGEESGSITLTDGALSSDYKIIIERTVPILQELDIVNQGGFLPDTVEEQLDLMVMAMQQLSDGVGRSLKISAGSTIEDLPVKSSLVGKYLAFDAEGNPIASSGTGSDSALRTDLAEDGAALIGIGEGTLGDALPFMPEMYGALGDGVTNDTLALQAMRDAVEAANGGTIELRKGAVYMVGIQATGGGYYLTPEDLLLFEDVTGDIIIRMNGATIRCVDGLKYGTFYPLTGLPYPAVLPFNDPTYIATPYLHMIGFRDCSGKIRLEGPGELDGNIENQIIGGGYDNQGTQIRMDGFVFFDCTGKIEVNNIETHHHGLDGYYLDGPSAVDGARLAGGTFHNIDSHHNGRQGLSIVGGGDYTFSACKFNDTGYDLGDLTYSPPGAGVDIEAEGKLVRRILFESNCEFSANIGVGLLVAEGDSADIVVKDSVLIGDYSWTTWPAKPYISFHRCTLIGVAVNLNVGTLTDPEGAVKFYDCYFTNDVTLSTSGLLHSTGAGNVMISGAGTFFRGGQMEHTAAGTLTQGSVDGSRFEDFTVISKGGGFTNYGRYSGKCRFISSGAGTINGIPGGGVGLTDLGEAEDPFFFVTGGVSVRYPSTLELPKALTFANPLVIDASDYRRRRTVTLTGNTVFAIPTNVKAGDTGAVLMTQDATGSRLLTGAAGVKIAGGPLSTVAGKVDRVEWVAHSPTLVYLNITKDFA